MAFSIRYTPVGQTASVGGLTLRAALNTAADLEMKGHKDIVIVGEDGEEVGHDELELLVRGNRFTDDA